MGLQKKILFLLATGVFLSLVSALFISRYVNEKEMRNGVIGKARTILGRVEVAREFIALQGGLQSVITSVKSKYKSPDQVSKEDKLNILKQVPIFASMKIADKNSKDENFSFRVFSDDPRKKENMATPSELEILNLFRNDSSLKEHIVQTDEDITVFRPVRLTESEGCLTCHGKPETSPWNNGQDILGYKMENWSDGKLHGVFSIKTVLKDVRIAQNLESEQSGDLSVNLLLTLGIGASGIIVMIVGYFISRNISNKLVALSDNVKTQINDVYMTADDISNVGQSLMGAMSEQQNSIQQTVSTVEEISAMVKRNYDFIDSCQKTSVNTNQNLEVGRKNLEELTQTIKQISHSNDSTEGAIENQNKQLLKLISLMNGIIEKTQVINEIVFQTKLLSFNASVEAARAGEHGKGFAVVAEEIGSLAAMSGNSSKEISELLTKNLEEVNSIIKKAHEDFAVIISENKRVISRGAESVERFERVLLNIFEQSGTICSSISSIAEASKEQNTGVNVVNQAMNELEVVNQSNTKNSQIAASSADKLREKAEELTRFTNELITEISGKK